MILQAVVLLYLLLFGNCVANTTDSCDKTTSTQVMLQKALSAVVSISTSGEYTSPFTTDPFWQFFNIRPLARTRACGSGVIVDSRGYVVTCCHVVENAKKIRVTLSDSNVYDADVVLKDKKTDLAVIKLKVDNLHTPLQELNLSESKPFIGGKIVVIGNAFGVGQTVTHGIISAINRPFGGQIMVQTDAAINPGNSGGPGLDKNGNIIGIASAIASRTGAFHGVGFLIPVESVRYVVNMAINNAKPIVYPFKVDTADQSIVDAVKDNLTEKQLQIIGCTIISAVYDSKIGLHEGDILISIDGHNIPSKEYLDFFLMQMPIGHKCKAMFMSSFQNPTIKFCEIPILEKKENFFEKITLTGKHALNNVVVADLTQEAIEHLVLNGEIEDLKLGNEQGVIVVNAEQNSIVKNGDIIIQINGYRITCIADIKNILQQKDKQGFSIAVKRGNTIFQQSIY
jgi:S1-C subfamily serine protease